MAVDLKAGLTRKIGPLPAWGWALAIGGGLLVWRAFRGKGGGSSGVIGSGGDFEAPTGVNPGSEGRGLSPEMFFAGGLPIPIPATIGGGGSGASPSVDSGRLTPGGNGVINWPVGFGSIAPLPASGSLPSAPLSQTIGKPIAAVARRAESTARGSSGPRALTSGILDNAEAAYINRSRGIPAVITRTATAAKALPAAIRNPTVARKPSGNDTIILRRNHGQVVAKAATAARAAPNLAAVAVRKPASAPEAPVRVPVAVSRRGSIAL